MYFDRFDICEAWYVFLSQWHEGQWSLKYERLCKLTRPGFFKPSPLFSGNPEDLEENAKAIYDSLVERNDAGTLKV